MKIYQRPTFPTQFVGRIGNTTLVCAFTGVAPTNLSEVPVDLTSMDAIINAATNISLCSAAAINTDILRVLNSEQKKAPAGYAFNYINGKYQMFPKTLEFSPGIPFTAFEKVEYYRASNFTKNTGLSSANQIGEYHEFDFGQDVDIDHIELTPYSSAGYTALGFKLQRHDGNDWVDCESVLFTHNSTLMSVDLTQTYTASKFRMVVEVGCSSSWYMGAFSFYASAEPAVANTQEDINWFIMIPASPKALTGHNEPVMVGDAGGPNSGKELALTHYQDEAGANIKVLNLKIQANPIVEV